MKDLIQDQINRYKSHLDLLQKEIKVWTKAKGKTDKSDLKKLAYWKTNIYQAEEKSRMIESFLNTLDSLLKECNE